MDYLIYIGCAVLGCIVFYYIIKAAVKNAILETKSETKKTEAIKSIGDKPPTPDQVALQKKYQNGEMSFDDYRTQFDLLAK
jgi:hypothetical protein